MSSGRAGRLRQASPSWWLRTMLMINVTTLLSCNVQAQSAPLQAPSMMELPDLPATKILEILCSRTITATDYVEALVDRYQSGGFECLNSFIVYNTSKVSLSINNSKHYGRYRNR